LLAKLLIGLGLTLLVVGLTLQYAPWLLSWFGKLPGDLRIERNGSRLFIPFTSMIVVSILLSVIANLLFRR